MKVCVIGLGYIGLPTASLMATNGLHVIGVDVRHELVHGLAHGRVPIEEPGLKTLVEASIKSGRLSVAKFPKPADAFIICVPTPIYKDRKKADLTFVKSAAKSLLPVLKKGNLVILESTVPPGTTQDVLISILRRSGLDIPGDVLVAHCPERVLPGNILHELVSNDRIVGGIDDASTRAAREVYAQFVRGQIHLTDCTSAETIKLVENTFRDVNIAFANEVEAICQRLGINSWDVIRLANKHPRVKILTPGPGVGGHCIAVDPWFLVEAAPREARLTALSRRVNDGKPGRVIKVIMDRVKALNKKKTAVACLGITYKANVDDIRESPALHIMNELRRRKDLEVLVVDSHARPGNGLAGIVSFEQAISRADIVVLLVDHKEFLAQDWPAIAAAKGRDNILDFKGSLTSLLGSSSASPAGIHQAAV
ncbi:MAG: nucleotide sugar dehydrogenase [Elusimicrobia bacterium]|nr:nucleotide sugar dehydrogenase [Elusimicrobiota bacterium]